MHQLITKTANSPPSADTVNMVTSGWKDQPHRSVPRRSLFFLCATVALLVVISVFIYHSLLNDDYLSPPTLPVVWENFGRPRVTRILHQSWKTKKLPRNFQEMRSSWHRCYPNWLNHLWTDEDNRRLIADYYPWFLKQYDDLPSAICRADVSRYFYLLHYGGLYADLDTECVRPFEGLLANYSLVFGAMEGRRQLAEGHVQNSFMYSRPRHPFWLEVIAYVMDHPKAAAPGYLTGSDVLMTVIKKYRRRFPGDEARMKIYPPSFFNPFSWQKPVKECKAFNRMSSQQLGRCRDQFKDAFVIQYHTHTWG